MDFFRDQDDDGGDGDAASLGTLEPSSRKEKSNYGQCAVLWRFQKN